MPSRSPGRGARVVAETEYLKRLWRESQPIDQRVFSGPRGTRHDEQQTRPGLNARSSSPVSNQRQIHRGTMRVLWEREGAQW